MAASNRARLSLLLVSAVAASLVGGSSAGIYHIVGAGRGWRMAPNKTYYEEWTSTRKICLGDKLMFLYRSGVHNIVEVPTRELFEACSMSNITNRYQCGPTIIELEDPGPRFYFCGVGRHCEEGQKLAINVSREPTPRLEEMVDMPRLEEMIDMAEAEDDEEDSSSAATMATPTLLVACLLASLLIM